MSSQVVRIAPFTKGSLGAIGNEAERKKGVNHRNKDIDNDRTDLNMYLKESENGFYSEYNKIKKDLNVQARETKKGVAFEGMVITAERAYFEEHFGWKAGEPMSPELVQYWRESYNWAIKEIGYQGTDKNIISAVVHADETSLHLQMYYIPITDKWQEKVYEKDKDGKIKRNKNGSPLQARDKDGKIIYKQVENSNAPKLNRGEFWRLRGGKNSYSRLQDSFHEEVGLKYGLERGEIGSSAEHRTKHQWEMEQQQREKNELQKDLQGLQEMKAEISEVDTTGKRVLGNVIIKEDNLNRLKEQAKAYIVNKPRIEALNEREQAVEKRENSIGDKEAEMLKWEGIYYSQVQEYKYLKVDLRAEVEKEKKQYIELYKEQLGLNNEHSKLKSLVAEQSEEITKLKAENASLIEKAKQDIKTATEPLQRQIEILQSKVSELTERVRTTLEECYMSISAICKAVGMLKYDDNQGYKVYGLSEKQDRLIDAISNYGANWAEHDGLNDVADDIRKHIGLSKGIQNEIKELEPKSKDKGWERG